MSEIAGDGMPERALAWHRAGRAVALATVIETWGSAPRAVGAQLVIDGDGAMEGSVSGGCVEGAVVVEALEALEAGGRRILDYGVSDQDAFAVGLACGGSIRVLVEPVGAALPVAVLEALVAARAAREAVALEAPLGAGAHRLVRRGAGHEARFVGDRSGLEGEIFVAIHNPPLRMVVVGAVHIAQALVPMARIAGFDVTVVDPRPAFGAAARFDDVALVDNWPDAALAALSPDARTCVVTLTHDPKLDDPALTVALGSEAFYIGCLGSTRTHGKRVARLAEAGFTAADISRLDAPVGLDIGARGPAEIAVSILGAVVAALRLGGAAPRRGAATPPEVFAAR